MKKLLLLLALLPLAVYAEQRTVMQYGRSATVEFELYAADGTLSIAEADSGTEVTIVCDGDAGTTATNDFVDEGFAYSLVVTAAELECAHATLNVGATLNHAIIIETCGTPNAQHMLCPGDPYRSGNTAQSGTTTSTTLAAAEAYADDVLIGDSIFLVEDTGIGQKACITDNALSGDVVTHTTVNTAAASGTEYVIISDNCSVINALNGVVESKVMSTASAAITATSVAADTIGASEIATDAIGAAEIADDAIDADALAADTIGASEMAANAIGPSEIANDAIDATAVATDAIDADALAADAVDEIWNEVIETAGATYTGRCLLAALGAYAAGTVNTVTNVSTYKDTSDTSTRIVGTVTASGRGTMSITCP